MTALGRIALLAALALAAGLVRAQELTDCNNKKKMREAWFNAAESGRVDVMIDLLQRPGCVEPGAEGLNLEKDPERKPEPDRRTALFVAAAANQLAVVQLILLQVRPLPEEQRRAVIDRRDEHGDTPLMAAAHAGDRSIEKLLLAAGADRDAKNTRDVTAAKIAHAASGRALPECTPSEHCETGELPHKRSYLADAWKLGVEDLPLDAFQPYRPMYAIARWTSKVNRTPSSPTRGVVPFQDYGRDELKFQLSFKNELFSPKFISDYLGTDRFRVWFAYTQQSNWQILNGANSRPFRETNYQPELIVTYDNRDTSRPYTGQARSSLSPELINFGLLHESNGRSDPESRSWNRVYVQGGWQLGEQVSVMPRIWLAGQMDDNPDIRRYQRADVVLRLDTSKWGRYELLARNNLNFGASRSYFQLDWRIPGHFFGADLHLQATTGYGESLLDYNYRQTTFGFGLSMWEW
jgi:phospholipase A1/A2